MAAVKEKPLSGKELLFISEYLKDFNATRAAIEAGYSKKTARSIASTMLTKVNIQDEIKKQVDAILKDNKGLALKVVRECEKIAFSKLEDFMTYDDNGVVLISSEQVDTSALESIQFDETLTANGYTKKKRVKQHDKLKALEILAKYTALYSDAPTVPVIVNPDNEAVASILEKYGISKSEN